MRIFLSWSGERSKVLAQALHEWLPLVLYFAQPWMSHADIEAGERWAVEVARELEATNFGVICVTSENISSPWVLFEAGALAKSMQLGRAMPLLLDIDFRDVSGPLAQFQAKKAEREGLFEIVSAINHLSEQRIEDTRIGQLLDLAWPRLEKKISDLQGMNPSAKSHRPTQEVLEELVASIRGIEARLRRPVSEDARLRSRSKALTSVIQKLFSEESHDRPDHPVQLLMLTSPFQITIPWLYQVGLELYNALTLGNRAKIEQKVENFKEALKITYYHPDLRDFIDDEATFVALHLFHDDSVFSELLKRYQPTLRTA